MFEAALKPPTQIAPTSKAVLQTLWPSKTFSMHVRRITPSNAFRTMGRLWTHKGSKVTSSLPSKNSFKFGLLGKSFNVTITNKNRESSLQATADLPPADTWKQGVGFVTRTPKLRLSCEAGWRIASVHFASFGNPQGQCGAFVSGSCDANVSSVVQQACVGKEGC